MENPVFSYYRVDGMPQRVGIVMRLPIHRNRDLMLKEWKLTLVCLNWSSVDPVVFYNIFALLHVHPMG
jgi:hypothetical protein